MIPPLPIKAPLLKGTRSSQAGYTLAALMIMIMLMSIGLAVAMPSWTNFVQRDKEAEAIFRGLQYAEAIRVFQQRHGRLPTTLEELIKVEPRSIRQLYPNPLNESGKWGLLMQRQTPGRAPAGQRGGRQRAAAQRGGSAGGATQIGAGSQAGTAELASQQGGAAPGRTRGGGAVVAVPPIADGEENPSGGRLSLGDPIQRTAGPLVGVYPGVSGDALRSFNGATSYDAWRFQADLIPAPVLLGGDSAAPRVTSEWIGKPFRSDIQAQQPGQGAGPDNKPRDLLKGNALDRGTSPRRDAKSFRPGVNKRNN